HPTVRVIALAGFEDSELVREALAAGAVTYLRKNAPLQEFVRVIWLVAEGLPKSESAAQVLLPVTSAKTSQLGNDLTDREREVLALLAEGKSNQQIANRLFITPATVKFHTRSIRFKLGTSSRTETVVVALQHHLVGSSGRSISPG